MTLPKALADAEARADALINGNGGKTEEAEPANADPAPEANQPGQQPQGTPPQQDPQEQTDYKHKYDVLQGMFNTTNNELKTLKDQLRQLESRPDNSAQLQQLQQQLQTLQQQNEQLKQQASAQQPIQYNEALVSEYGEEFAKAVAEQSRSTYSADIKQMQSHYEAQLNELKQQLASTQQHVSQTSQDARMQHLSHMLSQQNIDFNRVDSDPEFHQWLAQEESPFSGQTRQELLSRAYQSGDLQRTARFYSAFMESQKTAPSNPLNNYVDPLSQTTPVEKPNAQPQQFDANELVKLNREYQEGRITTAEFERRENELFARLR